MVWLAVVAGLIGLGTWQVHRRAWKLALIERGETGLRARPVSPPAVARPDDAYRRVTATGCYLPGQDSFVQAATDLGAGWWVLTPLRTDAGHTLFVNRGFVPRRAAAAPPAGTVSVTGLLRLTEPGGGFLRSNDPAADRWYSRDIAAIAARRRLSGAAGYFIDAAAGPPAAATPATTAPQPVGGLTVIRFANNHLGYAVTWYMLAAMTLAAFLYWAGLLRRSGGPPR
ncbi:SURF1 family protein [Sphingomonas solaris]|uniref:SURF1-like protein n=1 Tax=Alterirhizorhabdus solaris TaxID=2529389 RepID=A0A558QY83_9SPHN|nr:SURF1 family protein [Sphingomonas solaris]